MPRQARRCGRNTDEAPPGPPGGRAISRHEYDVGGNEKGEHRIDVPIRYAATRSEICTRIRVSTECSLSGVALRFSGMNAFSCACSGWD